MEKVFVSYCKCTLILISSKFVLFDRLLTCFISIRIIDVTRRSHLHRPFLRSFLCIVSNFMTPLISILCCNCNIVSEKIVEERGQE